MQDNKDVEHLLKNIQEGLKKYSIKELNEAIMQLLNKKSDRNEEVTMVIDLVCKEFGINQRILKKAHARGHIQEAKQTAYCLLHFDVGLGIKHIAARIFSNWHKSVSIGLDRVRKANTDIKSDRDFLERYKKLQGKLINQITEIKNQE